MMFFLFSNLNKILIFFQIIITFFEDVIIVYSILLSDLKKLYIYPLTFLFLFFFVIEQTFYIYFGINVKISNGSVFFRLFFIQNFL